MSANSPNENLKSLCQFSQWKWSTHTFPTGHSLPSTLVHTYFNKNTKGQTSRTVDTYTHYYYQTTNHIFLAIHSTVCCQIDSVFYSSIWWCLSLQFDVERSSKSLNMWTGVRSLEPCCFVKLKVFFFTPLWSVPWCREAAGVSQGPGEHASGNFSFDRATWAQQVNG